MRKLILPLLTLVLMSACGGESGKEHVNVAREFNKKLYDQDYDGAKALATDASASMIDMIASFAKMGESMAGETEKKPFEFKVLRDSLSDDGNRAWVFIEGEEGAEEKIELSKVDGKWKVVFSKS
jgi:hypothetical protein